MFEEFSKPGRKPGSVIASALVHAGIAAVLFAAAKAPHATLLRAVTPGEKSGSRITSLYDPMRAPAAGAAEENHADSATVSPRTTPRIKPSTGLVLPQNNAVAGSPTPLTTDSTASLNPNAASGSDSLGDGNIRIALGSYFPQPKPDLGQLPHGFQGDVVVDVLIDETGIIRETKLVRGVSQQVDNVVIATVETWRFTPAERDGTPVASQQELLFHYGPV